MGPDALDNLIIHSLHARGRQSLPELATDTGANAKDILRRLHVLTGQRRLLTGFSDGACMYWLSGTPERDKVQDELQRLEAKRERVSTIPAVHAEEPPCVAARIEEKPKAIVETPTPVEPELSPTPVKPDRKPQRRYKAIVVRPEVRVTELSVSPLPGGGCSIQDGDVVTSAEVGEPSVIVVPYADIKSLIKALEQVYLEYAP